MSAISDLGALEVVAICNSSEESARRNALHFGVERAFWSIADLAAAEDIDLVSICLQVGRHMDVALPLLESGKAVLCEWPLARTTAEAEVLSREAGRRGVRAWVGLQGRLSPAVIRARRLISDGAIGALTSVKIEQSVPFQENPSRRTAYLQDADSGADFLAVPVAHAIDVMRFCVGLPEKIAPFSMTSVPVVYEIGSGEPIRRTSADQLAFSGVYANGAPVSALFRGGKGEDAGFILEIAGDKGAIEIRGPRGGRAQMAALGLRIRRGSGEFEILCDPDAEIERTRRFGSAANVHRLYERIAMAWDSGDADLASFEDAIALHRFIDAVRQPEWRGI